MNLFPYSFILTLALTIHIIKPSSISSSDDGPVSNRSNIALSEHRSKRLLTERIFGGQYVKDISKYPFIVFLWIEYEDNTGVLTTFCGATLLSTTHALTAAHCIVEFNCGNNTDDDNCFNYTEQRVEDITLYFGSIVPAKSEVSRKLKNVYVHPEYKQRDLTNKFDIAVLELSKPVLYSRTISSIKLPDPVTLGEDQLISTMTSSFFDTNKKCIILGWGDMVFKDKRESMTRSLKVSEVPLIGLDKCENLLHKSRNLDTRYLCTDNSICSKCPHRRNQICLGDSGGPIICGGVQVGVDSRSIGKCGDPNGPDVYTRVDINVQWIRDIMSNKYYRRLHEY